MSCLTILHTNPRESAIAVADIHLNQSIRLCAKIISNSARRLAKVSSYITANGVSVDRIETDANCSVNLLPDSDDPWFTPWINWACEDKSRAWWLVQYAFFLDRERIQRFDLDEEHGVVYERINQWAKNKLMNIFPEDETKSASREFPVVLPAGSILIAGNPIEAYRRYYSDLTKDAVRMRWTNRQAPAWMGEIIMPLATVVKDACTSCGVRDVDPRVCAFDDCPGKKAYNLKGA